MWRETKSLKITISLQDPSIIWMHWWAYAVECVSRINSIRSIIFYAIYGAVCFYFTIFPLMIVRILYLILSSPSSRTYDTSALFRVRSWNYGIRYILPWFYKSDSLSNSFKIWSSSLGTVHIVCFFIYLIYWPNWLLESTSGDFH